MGRELKLTEEQANLVQRLREPYRLYRKIAEKREEAERYGELAYSVPTVRKREGGVTGKRTDAAFAAWVIAKADTEREIQALEPEMQRSIRATMALLDMVEREKAREVLRERYVLFRDWLKIAEEMNASMMSVFRWHRAGLDEIIGKSGGPRDVVTIC